MAALLDDQLRESSQPGSLISSQRISFALNKDRSPQLFDAIVGQAVCQTPVDERPHVLGDHIVTVKRRLVHYREPLLSPMGDADTHDERVLAKLGVEGVPTEGWQRAFRSSGQGTYALYARSSQVDAKAKSFHKLLSMNGRMLAQEHERPVTRFRACDGRLMMEIATATAASRSRQVNPMGKAQV